jgi:hypothetical protein
VKHRFRERWSLTFLSQFDDCELPGEELFQSGDQVGAEAAARAALREAVRGHGSGCAEALPSLDSLGKMLVATDRPEEGTALLPRHGRSAPGTWGTSQARRTAGSRTSGSASSIWAYPGRR